MFHSLKFFRKQNAQKGQLLDKLKQGELTIEDILNDDETVSEIKTQPISDFNEL